METVIKTAPTQIFGMVKKKKQTFKTDMSCSSLVKMYFDCWKHFKSTTFHHKIKNNLGIIANIPLAPHMLNGNFIYAYHLLMFK